MKKMVLMVLMAVMTVMAATAEGNSVAFENTLERSAVSKDIQDIYLPEYNAAKAKADKAFDLYLTFKTADYQKKYNNAVAKKEAAYNTLKNAVTIVYEDAADMMMDYYFNK